MFTAYRLAHLRKVCTSHNQCHIVSREMVMANRFR